MKFDDPNIVSFKIEGDLLSEFDSYIETHDLNRSAVIRRMIIDFLKEKRGEVIDFKI